MTIKIRPPNFWKGKKNPFTKELKQEYMLYMHGFCDGTVAEKVLGQPVMVSFQIFKRTSFFKRYYPKMIHHPRYNKVLSKWLIEFVNKYQMKA